jgi:homoserine dehydrogenase
LKKPGVTGCITPPSGRVAGKPYGARSDRQRRQYSGLSGIFSGTLSWLFLQFDGTVPFTDLVDQAWQQGLTEPDPRVDLSGKDVMRKLVILAREAGYDIEPDHVRVESLVPTSCEEGLSTTSLRMAMS